MPDFAMLRDRSTGKKKVWFGRLARGWVGTSGQWNWQKHRLGILGAFYFMMLVTAHFAFSLDFGMSLVPGWVDALYPATHAHNSLQAGVAITLITMYVMYRFGGYKDYINLDQFWGLGKLLFSLSLLWFWFWFSSFIIFWFGAKPAEEAVLDLLFVGPYLPIFFIVFTFAFLVPLWAMIWNPLRKSVWGPVVIACGVLDRDVLRPDSRVRCGVLRLGFAGQAPDVRDTWGSPSRRGGRAHLGGRHLRLHSHLHAGDADHPAGKHLGTEGSIAVPHPQAVPPDGGAGAGQARVAPNAKPCKNTFS